MIQIKLLLIIILFLCYNTILTAQSPGDFRSKQSGTWSAASSWETYNGSAWVDATLPPSSTDGIITILPGHTITANSNITADQVIINANGSLNITSAIFTLNNGAGTDLLNNGTLNLSGGTQNGKGSVEIAAASAFNWTGGTYGGTGTTKIDAGASLNMSTNSHYLADSVTINNYGTWVWTGGYFYYYNASPVVNNYGTFNINTDYDVDNWSANTGTFINQSAGVINKTGSSDTYFIDFASFTNKGTIHIISGIFRMYTRFFNTGNIIIDSAANFNSTGGLASFNTGGAVNGNGNFNIDGGTDSLNAGSFTPLTLNISSGIFTILSTLNRSPGSVLNMSNGTINGAGTINFNNGSTFNWTGGYISETGITNIKSGAAFTTSGGSHYVADTRTINNYSTWNWTGGNLLFYNGSPSVNNYGSFNINTDYDVDRYNTNTGIFINQPGGVINKTGSISNDTYFSNIASFTNAGTINIDSGTISLVSRFINTGTVSLGNNGTLNFTNNNIGTISAGSTIKGSGTITINNNSIDSILTSNITAKTINVYSGNLHILAPLHIKNGNTVNLSNGTIRGNSSIEFNSKSTFNWTAGYLAGKLVATIDSGAAFTMSGTGNHYLADTIVLNNHATWVWTGGAFYYYNASPVVNNYGTFNINTDYDVDNWNTTTGIFNNKAGGVINKTGDVNEQTYFRDFSAFVNEGTINVKSGKVQLYINTTNTGAINVAPGNYIQFIAGTTDLNTGSAFTGSGNINIDGAIVNVNKAITISSNTVNLNSGVLGGTAALTMQQGSVFNWNGGVNGGSGALNINDGAIFNMGYNNTNLNLSDTKKINNSGTWTWKSGDMYYNGGSPAITNKGIFNISTDANILASNNSTGTFTNQSAGVINKNGAPNDDTYMQGFAGFTNAGTINIISGFFRSYVRFTNTGTINSSFGAGMNFTGGIGNFNPGTNISGDGSINFDGGTDSINTATITVKALNIAAGIVTIKPTLTFKSATSLNISGGTLNGPGTINFNNGSVCNWSEGFVGGSDSINIRSGAILNIAGGSLYLSDTRVIDNAGTTNWSSGTIYFNGGSPSVINAGIFNINTDNVLSGLNATSGKFINQSTGVINKAGDFTDETRLQGLNNFSNKGTININSGSIKSYVGFNNTGTINVALGAGINFTGGVGLFNNGNIIKGAGTLSFDGGTDSINAGSVTINHVYISAGLLNTAVPFTFSNGKDLNISGGTFTGAAPVNFNNGSVFNWTGGIIGGTDSLHINTGASANLNGGTHYLDNDKVLNNKAVLNWYAGGINFLGETASVNNTGSFNIYSDDDITGQGNTGGFNNQSTGIINKSGSPSATTTLSGFNYFNNYGTVNINSGMFTLNVTGVHTGTYNIALGAWLAGNINMSFTGNSLKNNGTISLATLSLNNTAAQVVNGNGSINSLLINNAAGISLTGTQTITTALNLSKGNIALSDNDLVLGDAALLTGGSDTSYIITQGKGSFQRKVLNNNNNFLFPVGSTAAYLPATIGLTAASISDNFKVRVLPNLYSGYDGKNDPAGSAVTQNSVSNTWFINEAVAGGSGATVTLQWNAGNEQPGFDRSQSRMIQYINNTWSANTAAAASGTDPYTLQTANITAFSPIGITNEFVTCTNHFTSLCAGTSISIPYNAIGSFNTGNKFTAQLSNAAGSFASPTNIGSRNSTNSGIINTTIPASVTPGTGYRIRVTSSDPSFKGSDNGYNIVISGCGKSEFVKKAGVPGEMEFFKVYPNPTNGNIQINCFTKNSAASTANIEIITLSGQKIYSEATPVINRLLNKIIHFNTNTPNGTYILKVTIGDEVFIQKIIYNK